MSSNLLLEGEVAKEPLLLEKLQDAARELARLRQQLAMEQSERELLQKQVDRTHASLIELRRVTMPFYRLLQSLHGEMDLMGVTEEAPRQDEKWAAIKARMAPRLRDAIDMLILQGSMKRTQLAAALKMDYSNCNKNVIQALLRQGWLVDNNGNLSLKQL